MSFSEKTVLSNQAGSQTAEPVNGALPTFEAGWQSPTSSGNSTTTATTSFTGTAELNAAEGVQVSCKSDVSGTLYFEFSPDGTNWDTFPTGGFSVSANQHEFHTAIKGPRHFRVRWTSSSLPSDLRIYTYYGKFRQPNAPLNQPLGLDADAMPVRPTFTWMDISRGLVSGMSVVKKFGRNPNVGTTYSPLTFGGFYRTPQSSAATTLRIKSGGNANDTAAGTGAQEITIEGLDQNFAPVTEALATAGASASASTSTTFTRVHRAYVSKSGTYATSSAGSHAGNIVVENTAGTQNWFTIDATNFPKAQTEIGAYSVPAGKTAYVFIDDLIVDSGKTVDAVFFHRGNIDETAAPYTAMRARSVLTGITGGLTDLSGRNVPFGPFQGPCDIGFMARVSATTGSVACEFEIFLVDE